MSCILCIIHVITYVQALSKNGKVFGNGIMVGVQQCIDKVSDVYLHASMAIIL